MTLEQLLSRAAEWTRTDPDPDARTATEALMASGDVDALSLAFGRRLTFGTAGIRGRLGPGPGQMNRKMVRQITAGLARYLLDTVPSVRQAGVVLGRDARRGSEDFAQEAAAVLTAAGIPVHQFPGVTATPLVAFAVRALQAAAGVMVTASHNPATDNGYKVYWGDGAQITPPHDRGIAERIDAVAAGAPAPLAGASAPIHTIGDAVVDAYIAGVLATRVHTGAQVDAVYTALHGVGYAPLQRAVAAAGHRPVIPVPAQVQPDPDFPTVPSPNPEQPAALDLALAEADRSGARLVIAHDPDADRLAVAVKGSDGRWARLSGNDLGLLLAEDLLSHGAATGPRMVATTIVSTSLLRDIAAHHGADFVETLTGFKWIAAAARAYPGTFVMGFEEAIGYCPGTLVGDKDGVSTAILVLDLAAWCAARGATLIDHLADLYVRYGLSFTAQRAVRMSGADALERMAQVMAKLRATPPTELGGRRVHRIRDLSTGVARDLRTGAEETEALPRSNVLVFELDGGDRVVVRPSGTEPKLKLYVEVRRPVPTRSAYLQARDSARAQAGTLIASMSALTGLSGH